MTSEELEDLKDEIEGLHCDDTVPAIVVKDITISLINEIKHLQQLNEYKYGKGFVDCARSYEKQMGTLRIEKECYQAALEEIISIPQCTCGDRKQGFSCICGNYNADETARKALGRSE